LSQANPDLILTQKLCDVCAISYREVLEVVKQLPSIPQVMSLDPGTLEDVLRDILRVGEATARMEEAQQVVEDLRKRIDLVVKKASMAKTRPKVLSIEWMDPIFVAGHWIPQMVTLAGGQEGLSTSGQASRQIEWQHVVEYQPEVIIVMPCGFSTSSVLAELPLVTGLVGWDELPAVRDGRLYAVDDDSYYSRSGPRLIDGLEMMAEMIHPELFSETFRPGTVLAVDRVPFEANTP